MKISNKILSVLLTLSIVFGTFAGLTAATLAVDNVVGDTNSDSVVNSFDALMVIRYCTGEISLSAAEKKAADVDGDNKITATDALYILHYSVGKIHSFPSAPVDNQKIKIVGGFYYDPATGKVTNNDGSGLLGFSYDRVDNVFYSESNAWQRTFGYTDIYDYAAPFIVCWYDTTRIFFTYDNKDWMLQLWKGQYGFVLIGCEIGLYYRDFEDDSFLTDNKGRKFFKCAEDDMLTKMSLSLYKSDTFLFRRREQYSWWLTGFTLGANGSFGFTPEETAKLRMDAKIKFTDTAMLYAFIDGLNHVETIEHNASKKVRPYKFEKGKNYSVNLKENSVSFIWQ